MKQNRFPALNAALESEGLLETWDMTYPAIPYGGNFSYTFYPLLGSKYGHYVSIHRFDDGTYERPIHYSRG